MICDPTRLWLYSWLSLFIPGTCFGADETPPSLDVIVRNVAANEELYRNIDVEFNYDYELLKSPNPDVKNLLLEIQSKTRLVYQDDMLRCELKEQKKDVSGKSLPRTTMAGYDGDQTRVLDHGLSTPVGNIHLGRVEISQMKKPHLLLLRHAFVGTMKLSQYLSSKKYGDYFLSVKPQAVEVVDGLTTIKLLCETRVDGQKAPDQRFVWLATERNYFPIRTVGYASSYSESLPLEEGSAKDFREVKPGVWFPHSLHWTIYDEVAAAKGESKLSNRGETIVTKVDVEPHYDVTFFRDVEFPAGTLIYKVADNGEIVEAERTPPAVLPTKQRFWWTAPLILICLAGIASFVYHRRRSR